jgi:hypothetical protein
MIGDVFPQAIAAEVHGDHAVLSTAVPFNLLFSNPKEIRDVIHMHKR